MMTSHCQVTLSADPDSTAATLDLPVWVTFQLVQNDSNYWVYSTPIAPEKSREADTTLLGLWLPLHQVPQTVWMHRTLKL